jgi:hypothetical protein
MYVYSYIYILGEIVEGEAMTLKTQRETKNNKYNNKISIKVESVKGHRRLM